MCCAPLFRKQNQKEMRNKTGDANASEDGVLPMEIQRKVLRPLINFSACFIAFFSHWKWSITHSEWTRDSSQL